MLVVKVNFWGLFYFYRTVIIVFMKMYSLFYMPNTILYINEHIDSRLK